MSIMYIPSIQNQFTAVLYSLLAVYNNFNLVWRLTPCTEPWTIDLASFLVLCKFKLPRLPKQKIFAQLCVLKPLAGPDSHSVMSASVLAIVPWYVRVWVCACVYSTHPLICLGNAVDMEQQIGFR